MLTSGSNPFPGRILFDHQPKTGGQAVNAWLRKVLGEGCVSNNLIGSHRELTGTYGGRFSIVSGHTYFSPAEGLDPRYAYATVIREPMDRVISWIFFVLSNHTRKDLPGLFDACTNFIESEGNLFDEMLRGHISNTYVNHFSRVIATGGEDDETLIRLALEVLDRYQVVGLHHRMPDFINDFAAFIGIPAPAELDRVNVTVSRPNVESISPRLRERIAELNQLDLRFFGEACALVERRLAREDRPTAPQFPGWTKLDPPPARHLTHPDLTVHAITMTSSNPATVGSVMTFTVEFELHAPVRKLQAGIHIFDDLLCQAFGVNSQLLGLVYADKVPGRYRLVHHVVAQLPIGRFTAGFSFSDIGGGRKRELFWRDIAIGFSVITSGQGAGVGYSICPARQSLLLDLS